MSTRAWPAMPSFLAGQKLTAAGLNQVGTFASFWADPPTVRATQSVTQNLTSGTDAQITLDNKQWDSDSFWQTSSPWNLVIPSGWGNNLRASFRYSVAFPFNSTGARAVYLKKNGTRITGSTVDDAANNDVTIVNASCSALVNSGDTIQLWAWQNSGSTLTTITSPDVSYIECWIRGTGSP